MFDEPFNFGDRELMEQRLEEMRARHRTLDEQILALQAEGGASFQIMALKREKLRLRDQITWLSCKLTPDIIA